MVEPQPKRSRRSRDHDFEKAVARAIDSLPHELASHMSNVGIVIEELPSTEMADEMGIAPSELLGVYQGVPLTSRGQNYFGVLPDRIVLFRRNIEDNSSSELELVELVRTTVIHEIAHHFGIDDERLEELGW